MRGRRLDRHGGLNWQLFNRMMELRRPCVRYIALLETVLTTNFWEKL